MMDDIAYNSNKPLPDDEKARLMEWITKPFEWIPAEIKPPPCKCKYCRDERFREKLMKSLTSHEFDILYLGRFTPED